MTQTDNHPPLAGEETVISGRNDGFDCGCDETLKHPVFRQAAR